MHDEIITAMMKENTGVHMLDSGGVYGRNWERNQNFSFDNTKEVELSIDVNYGIEVTINVAHWMRNNLSYSETLNIIFDYFCRDSEESYLTDIDSFVNMLSTLTNESFNYHSENTYNRDCSLSQVIQYTAFEITSNMAEILNEEYKEIINEELESGYYVLCDVRGGYTKAKAFAIEDLDTMFNNVGLHVHDVVTDCATDAVSEFFYSGDGNKIIKEAIFKAMSNQIKL